MKDTCEQKGLRLPGCQVGKGTNSYIIVIRDGERKREDQKGQKGKRKKEIKENCVLKGCHKDKEGENMSEGRLKGSAFSIALS